jgi:hypothetical protein
MLALKPADARLSSGRIDLLPMCLAVHIHHCSARLAYRHMVRGSLHDGLEAKGRTTEFGMMGQKNVISNAYDISGPIRCDSRKCRKADAAGESGRRR